MRTGRTGGTGGVGRTEFTSRTAVNATRSRRPVNVTMLRLVARRIRAVQFAQDTGSSGIPTPGPVLAFPGKSPPDTRGRLHAPAAPGPILPRSRPAPAGPAGRVRPGSADLEHRLLRPQPAHAHRVRRPGARRGPPGHDDFGRQLPVEHHSRRPGDDRVQLAAVRGHRDTPTTSPRSRRCSAGSVSTTPTAIVGDAYRQATGNFVTGLRPRTGRSTSTLAPPTPGTPPGWATSPP